MRYIAYYRVSTKRQGESGLGLEAQRAYIAHYLAPEDIVTEFVEVKSAKSVVDRPQLKQALALCRQNGYGLAVAKVDRLSRLTEHALSIRKQLDGYLFACDIPMRKGERVDKFTLTIYMAIADRERELIAIRTKQALDVKRHQAGEWRTSQLNDVDRLRGAHTNLAEAVRGYRTVKGYVTLLREQGYSYQRIADILNEEGHITRKGKTFKRMTVKRLLERNTNQI